MTQDDPEIDYYRDNALTHSSDDQFQHEHYVEVLKDILLHSETPINIGLYGKWGVGKSSIVHMLKEKIETDNELEGFEYVEVDAWGIAGKSLQQEILEKINKELQQSSFKQEELEDKLYNVHQVDSVEFKKLFKSYWWIWAVIAVSSIFPIMHIKDDIFAALSIIGFASIIAVLIPLSRLFFSTSKKIIPRVVSTIQFNKIYDEMIENCENRKKILVVVIDNLDRCDDTVAVELLGIIQTFMVKKNCINILACDDEAIVTHLKNVKKYHTDKDGYEFLSKFFQVTIKIPAFIGGNLSEYTEKLIKKRSVKFGSLVKPMLISGVIENPRKINQFLNIAVALYKLAKLKEDNGNLTKGIITRNTNFLMKIIVIRHEWPKLYKTLESNPNLLNNKNELEQWFDKSSNDGNDDDKEEIKRFRNFHNLTINSYTNDIISFLRLDQVSYAALSDIGKFEDAFVTLNPKAEEIFKKLDNEKQEQYFNKIDSIMKEYEGKPEKLGLLNCASSLIKILQHISNDELRTRALAILGGYMSLSLLEYSDKFDIDELNLFDILEEMTDNFSELIYNKLISKTFDQKNLDEDLLEKFFKKGNVVNTKVLDQVDSKFAKVIDKNESSEEFITKLIKNYHWKKNNITKPSKIVTHIISRINFNETTEDQILKEIYKNIKDSITDKENQKYYERILEIIKTSIDTNGVLHQSLLEYLKNNPIEDFKTSQNFKQEIFESLCDLIEKIPDMTQNIQILELIIPLYQLIVDPSRRYISSEEYSTPYTRIKIINYATNLISNTETNLQNRGFALLRTINTKFDGEEPAGVIDAMVIATNLINKKSEHALVYIKFIFEYKDRFTSFQSYDFIGFIQNGLQSKTSENILNNLIIYIEQSPDGIITDVFDQFIELAKKTTYSSVKEQCKQIFIPHKNKLSPIHKNKIKEIFGESILD